MGTEKPIDGSIGCGVAIEDADGLADALANILNTLLPDPARLAAIVQHHRIGSVAQQYMMLLRQLRAARDAAKDTLPLAALST